MLKIVLISYPHRYKNFPQYPHILFTLTIYENNMKNNKNGLTKPKIFKKIKKSYTVYMLEKQFFYNENIFHKFSFSFIKIFFEKTIKNSRNSELNLSRIILKKCG